MWASAVRKEEPQEDGPKPNLCVSVAHDLKVAWNGTKDEWVHFFDEVKDECTPSIKPANYYKDLVQNTLQTWIHIPYFPAFHRPGWLLRYLLGPFDAEWLSLFIAGESIGYTAI